MEYQTHEPSVQLRPYVRCYWMLRGVSAASLPAAPDVVVPDGHMEWVFHMADPFCEATPDGPRPKPRVLFVGEMRRPVQTWQGTRVNVLGIRFTAIGARAILRVPAHELVDRSMAWQDVADPEMRGLAERVLSAEPGERVRVLDGGLLARVRAGRLVDPLVAKVARLIACAPVSLDVAKIAADAGLTTRQLERRFVTSVGIPPKPYASVLRFRRAFEAMELESPVWARIAIDAGFYDQSHFIREFRRYTTMTPRAFFGKAHAFADLWPARDVAFVQSRASVAR